MRYLNWWVKIGLDLVVLAAAFLLSFGLRFEFDPPPGQLLRVLLFSLPYVVVFQYLMLMLFGVNRVAWRYIGLADLPRFVGAVATSVGALTVWRLVFADEKNVLGFLRIPLGVLGIDLLLAFLGVVGVRIMFRMLAERSQRERLVRAPGRRQVPTLLVGAGSAGVLVAKELQGRPDLGIRALGFVDDDPAKKGTYIQGLKVFGPSDELPQIAAHLGVEQLIIAIANATSRTIRDVTRKCEATGLPVKIIPGVYEIVGGQVNLSRLRDVSIEDLLGREVVQLDTPLIQRFLSNRRVLITGAGGSIGSELCRQVARFGPESLVLVEQHENSLFHIHRELSRLSPHLDLRPRICDICDTRRVSEVFAEARPHVVFHAAAHKHVPMMEYNPHEAVKNNVFGTLKVARAANAAGADAFVMISTDKAVNPTSIMGASKRLAEIVIQSLATRSAGTKFVAVRFGNVLGSAGSVVPIFKEQIARGGPVTITHPDMTRYFMTIPEACQLVMQAAAMGTGGEIFVLDMGQPVRIIDLATDLIRLSGLEPGEDIRIEVTGIRPGEKLYEEIGFDAEKMDKTRHPKIYIGRLSPAPWDRVEAHLERLSAHHTFRDRDELRAVLKGIVPEMQAEARDSDRPPAAARSGDAPPEAR